MPKSLADIDVEVARRIMGLVVVSDEVNHRGFSIGVAGIHGQDLPRYSADVTQAMKVFDRMRFLGHRWLLNADTAGFHLRNVVCVHQDDVAGKKEYTCDRPLGTAGELGDLPKVICEAALKEIEQSSEIAHRV